MCSTTVLLLGVSIAVSVNGKVALLCVTPSLLFSAFQQSSKVAEWTQRGVKNTEKSVGVNVETAGETSA